MGTGYKANTSHHYSISENLKNIKENYAFSNGWFGSRGNSSRESTRHIESENPIFTSKDFYDKLTKGAIGKNLPNGKGKVSKMKDGSIISYRPISSSDGSPAVDINIRKSNNSGGIKQQKIHFVKKG